MRLIKKKTLVQKNAIYSDKNKNKKLQIVFSSLTNSVPLNILCVCIRIQTKNKRPNCWSPVPVVRGLADGQLRSWSPLERHFHAYMLPHTQTHTRASIPPMKTIYSWPEAGSKETMINQLLSNSPLCPRLLIWGTVSEAVRAKCVAEFLLFW